MVESRSLPGKLFVVFNYAFLTLLAFICIFPIIHVLAVSFSSVSAAESGQVKLWPVGFNTNAYKFVLTKDAYMNSLLVSLKRVLLGTAVNMAAIVTVAYPLSKEVTAFRMRTVYVWIFFFTALFGGGLIPTYMVVKETGLINTLWALILPGAVPVFSVVLLLNFFRGLPKELEESALIDGAGHFTIMWRIYVPLSLPAMMTLLLFAMVNHWNAWFDAIIYMNSPDRYPLQAYLQTIVVEQDATALAGLDEKQLSELSNRTFNAAQIFLGALPVLLVYPFLQKYFMKGIVLGSVKG